MNLGCVHETLAGMHANSLLRTSVVSSLSRVVD